jgi:hypothetical protein
MLRVVRYSRCRPSRVGIVPSERWSHGSTRASLDGQQSKICERRVEGRGASPVVVWGCRGPIPRWATMSFGPCLGVTTGPDHGHVDARVHDPGLLASKLRDCGFVAATDFGLCDRCSSLKLTRIAPPRYARGHLFLTLHNNMHRCKLDNALDCIW